MKQNKKRLLVLSAPMGAGHIKAAEALCQTYIQKFGGEAFHVDFLTYLNPAFSHLAEKGYYLMTKHVPILYKIAYEKTDKYGKSAKTLGKFLFAKKYIRLIEKYKPDIILSTHFLPSVAVSRMYKYVHITNGVVVTDFVSHPMWTYQNNQKFFVAHEGMVGEMEKIKVGREKICVSGIPVRPNFLKSFNTDKLRKKFKLDSKKPVLLVMSGGNAIGPFVEILESLTKVKNDFQVLVITGKNKKMYEELKKQFKLLHLTGKVLGLVKNMEEYMAVSSLLISKAGGLTIAEALTVGLPMLIINPTPGQEEGNTVFLERIGAGIHIKKLNDLNLTIDELLKNTKKISEMSENAKKQSLPNAAETILKEMIRI